MAEVEEGFTPFEEGADASPETEVDEAVKAEAVTAEEPELK